MIRIDPENFDQTIKVPESGIFLTTEDTLKHQLHLGHVLISKGCIESRIKKLAETISYDYSLNVFAIVIMKGALVFFSDLMKCLVNNDTEVQFDICVVSSYVNTESSGNLNLRLDIESDIRNKDVLIVEDIIDTGATLSKMKKYFLEEKGAKSARVCVLLDKYAKRKEHVDIEYVGFQIPNGFVVGYGLDYNQFYRDLPYVGILNER